MKNTKNQQQEFNVVLTWGKWWLPSMVIH